MEAKQSVEIFYLEQRESLIQSLIQSEKQFGPIGAKVKKTLIEDQEQLQQSLERSLRNTQEQIVDHNTKTKNLKKYNLRNVR